MSSCYFCGSNFPEKFEVFRSTECPSCGRDVKICLNCKYYSPGSKWDCRESISEAVRDKERANFCEYFLLGSAESDGKIRKKAEEAKSAFNNLFGDE